MGVEELLLQEDGLPTANRGSSWASRVTKGQSGAAAGQEVASSSVRDHLGGSSEGSRISCCQQWPQLAQAFAHLILGCLALSLKVSGIHL